MRFLLPILFAAIAVAQPPKLPLGKIPKGKVVLVMQPHHDDHTTDYGMGGLIARMVDEGYTAYYVRASNDEKDGAHGYPRNDMINLRESIDGTRALGMKEVISLNWRNDYMNPIPLNELRAQLILLMRKLKPDVVLGHNPWEHYQKNPDHRNVSRAMAEAWWMAGYANVLPEHITLGLQPHSAWYLYGKARLDWGLGHRPNIAIELNTNQVRRKQQAYVAHRNVYANPASTRALRAALAQRNLHIPEWENLSDADAAVKMEEWHMDWISRKRGAEAGVNYAEDYYFTDEFDHLPGLKEFLTGKKSAVVPGPRPAPLPAAKQSVLVVTAGAADYLLYAGGTLASMIAKGAEVRVLRITNDEKDSWSLSPEETALRVRKESEEAARILGVTEVTSLGYRAWELADVSFTEIRDRIALHIRQLKPSVLFIPNPHTEHDRVLDRYYAGAAAEDAWRSAGFANIQLAHGQAGLKPHITPELYYYAPPVDPRRNEPESTATFVPQPRTIDITPTLDRKIRAIQALRTINESLAQRLRERFATTGRKLPLLDTIGDSSVNRLAEIQVRGLSNIEEFRHVGAQYRVPGIYR